MCQSCCCSAAVACLCCGSPATRLSHCQLGVYDSYVTEHSRLRLALAQLVPLLLSKLPGGPLQNTWSESLCTPRCLDTTAAARAANQTKLLAGLVPGGRLPLSFSNAWVTRLPARPGKRVHSRAHLFWVQPRGQGAEGADCELCVRLHRAGLGADGGRWPSSLSFSRLPVQCCQAATS